MQKLSSDYRNRRPTDPEKLEKRIKRCDTARMWMVVLGAVLLLGGYVTSLLPIMYACVVPLAAAGILTYVIKFAQKKLDEIGQTPDDGSEDTP